jgi:hypothetical protein
VILGGRLSQASGHRSASPAMSRGGVAVILLLSRSQGNAAFR